MVFAHDTEVSLAAATALINTADGDDEHLGDPAALTAFLAHHGWTGRHDGTEAELREVRALRPRLRRVWESEEDEVVAIVNSLLRESGALPQLIRHDGVSFHLHAVPRDAPLATRMAVEAAMALVDVVRDGQLDRLRLCERPGCDNVLADLTKNRSKRFCEAGCGNRAAASAYRARKAATRG